MYTTQAQLRKAFWAEMAAAGVTVSRKRTADFGGPRKQHNTDTRCAWCDWIDNLQESGQISPELAERATL